jgi:outer membrane protein assembly factor BamB
MKKTTLLIIALFVCFGLFAQDFAEWRGPQRTGIYNETNLLKSWPENGPDMLWHIDSIPNGYASVSVANNTIYTTGRIDSTDYLIAITLTGKQKWIVPFGRAWMESFSESRSTPTVENDRVYVSSGMGDIACVNANTGELIWDLKATERFGGLYHRWGISESLLIVDDKLIFTPGGEKTSIVALDKMTGVTKWTSIPLNDYPSYASPIVVERAEKKIIITSLTTYIIGVDAENGEMLWNFNFGAFSNNKGHNNQTNSPLYHDGKLFFTSGYDHRNVMLEISESANRVRFLWTDSILDVHHGGVVKFGDYIYGASWEGNRHGKWTCLDWNTGKTMYSTEWINKGSIVAADDMLYCYDERDGNIGLVEPTPNEFKLISSFVVPYGKGVHWSHLVINKGILYVRHGQALMAYDISEKIKN